ncbi:Hypothetical predicted protein [Mytilus galloprovincialis]|uniref:Uncharacterized protein n=1 Tax=Mytilus galloprovincialis TaxID=29158 RepID=A0A8B6G150_MYTGA|nr:Hypothetical predicted protein [Mytilus galloprovincialis]
MAGNFNTFEEDSISKWSNFPCKRWKKCDEHTCQKHQYQQQRYVTLGGDGRADTPGHSAKFGSYTMLDLDEGVFVDIQLLQRNEVKSSCDMEKEELQRSLEFCKDHNIKIKTLVTDRHVQINKRVRENMEDTTHAFNVWHVAKGKDR